MLGGLPLIARVTEGAPAGIGLALGDFVGATAITVVAAMASYHRIEKRFLGLKPRLETRAEAS